MAAEITTTKQDVSDLLENFKDYVNPEGVSDPWFEIGEINQQFAWEDIPGLVLEQWLGELADEGLVVTRQTGRHAGREWAWKVE